jgi:branched-chain amino acid transport system permease protein
VRRLRSSATGTAVPVSASRHASGPAWLWALVLVGATALPLWVSEYHLFQLTMTLIHAIVMLGLLVLTGYSGQISLGHGAFYAIGAYATVILVTRFGLPVTATLPVSALTCLLAGFLFGRPALRLEGHYLALATFALAVATPPLLKHKQLQAFTGGVGGLMIDKPSVPFGWSMAPDTWLYGFTLTVTVVLFVLTHNLLAGRIGRGLLAIRDHPTAATAMGVDTARYKSQAFALSACYAGIAGSLSAMAVQFVSPDSFPPMLSILFLVGAVVGGMASLWGPLFGAVFVQVVPNVADELSKSAAWAIYGGCMVASVFLMKNGIVGTTERLGRAVFRRFGRARAMRNGEGGEP